MNSKDMKDLIELAASSGKKTNLDSRRSPAQLVKLLLDMAESDPVAEFSGSNAMDAFRNMSPGARQRVTSFNITKNSIKVSFDSLVNIVRLLDKIIDLSRYRQQICDDPALGLEDDEEVIRERVEALAKKAGIKIRHNTKQKVEGGKGDE